MHRRHKSAGQRIALVAAVGLVALIGNMRASGAPPAPSPVPLAAAPQRSGAATAVPVERFGPRPSIVTPDDTQLVPAIYAWDPDVRFVYYRHVSKWM